MTFQEELQARYTWARSPSLLKKCIETANEANAFVRARACEANQMAQEAYLAAEGERP